MIRRMNPIRVFVCATTGAMRACHCMFLPGLTIAILFSTGCESKKQTATTPPPTTSAPVVQEVTRTANRGPVKFSVKVDRTEVVVPDALSLTLRVEAESGVKVTVPKLEGIIGPFFIVEPEEHDENCGTNSQCKSWKYKLEARLPGDFDIPALKVSFEDPRPKADGSTEVYSDSAETQPITIHVTQTLADVQDPRSLPMPFQTKLLIWGGAVLAAMIAIALFARWWKKRQLAPKALPHAIQLTPQEWALQELDKLTREDLIKRGLTQEFYYRINALLRRYIELRFNLMAGELTTEEFISELGRSRMLEEEHKTLLRRFVDACDPVKYARHQPTAEEIRWVEASAREFILQTAQTLSLRNGNMIVAQRFTEAKR